MCQNSAVNSNQLQELSEFGGQMREVVSTSLKSSQLRTCELSCRAIVVEIAAQHPSVSAAF